MHELRSLGAQSPSVRDGLLAKSGPLKTDQDFFIIDAPFKPLLTSADIAGGADGSGKDGKWGVEELSRRIKLITGVLEVGLFTGLTGVQAQEVGKLGGQRPVAVYFGLQDGSVKVRHADEK